MGSKPVDKPIDYDVFAADLTYLLEKLDVGPFVFIGASMGPGEAVHTYMNSEYVRKNCRVCNLLFSLPNVGNETELNFPLIGTHWHWSCTAIPASNPGESNGHFSRGMG